MFWAQKILNMFSFFFSFPRSPLSFVFVSLKIVEVPVICFLKFIYLFWERERERERENRGGAGREGERIPSRLHTVSTEPNVGLELTNCEIMTLAKIKSRTPNQLSFNESAQAELEGAARPREKTWKKGELRGN